jgi:hypothetical protein
LAEKLTGARLALLSAVLAARRVLGFVPFEHVGASRDFSPKETETVLELLDELGNYGEPPYEVGRERIQRHERRL